MSSISSRRKYQISLRKNGFTSVRDILQGSFSTLRFSLCFGHTPLCHEIPTSWIELCELVEKVNNYFDNNIIENGDTVVIIT